MPSDSSETNTVGARWLLPVFLLLIFLAYFFTLYPGIGPGDSAEMQIVGSQLGIAHPPGYPLYTLLAFLFSRLPLGDVAWELNLLSALFSVGAAFFVYKISFLLTQRVKISALAMLFFAFSPIVWRYSIVAEVFSLNNLICAAILYVSLMFVEKKKESYFLWFAFLFGLGASNHHLVLFFVFPLFWIMVLPNLNYFLRLPIILKTTLCFLAGLLPYIYLPLRYAESPSLVWGKLDSLEGFITHFTRAEYGTVTLDEKTADSADFFQLIFAYVSEVVVQNYYVGAILLFAGAFIVWKAVDLRKYRIILIGPLLFYVIVFHAMSHMEISKPLSFGVHARFWQQPQILLSVFLALGFVWLEVWLKPIMAKREARTIVNTLGLIAVIGFLARGFIEENQSNNHVVENYGRLILDQTPDDSVLITQTDLTTNSVRAVQKIHRHRKDVIHLDINMMDYTWYGEQIRKKYPDLRYPGDKIKRPGHEGFSFNDFYLGNSGKFEIYSSPEIESFIGSDLREEPRGMVSKILPVSAPVLEAEAVKKYYFDTLSRFDFAQSEAFDPIFWESVPFIQLQELKIRVANTIMRTIDGKGDVENLKFVAELLHTSFENLKAVGVTQMAVAKNYATVLSRLSQTDKSYINPAIAAYQEYISMANLTPFEQKRFAGFIRDLERRRK